MNRYPAICISVGNEYKFIYPADIMYISSEGSYSHLFIKDHPKIIVSKNLKELESILPTKIFLRVHHSYIINLIYVAKYLNEEQTLIELTDGSLIPLSRRKKTTFLEKFTKI